MPNQSCISCSIGREDLGRLGLRAEVAGFGEPDVERSAEADQCVLVLGLAGIGEVLDLVRIDLRVVELFVRQARREQGERGAGQLRLERAARASAAGPGSTSPCSGSAPVNGRSGMKLRM